MGAVSTRQPRSRRLQLRWSVSSTQDRDGWPPPADVVLAAMLLVAGQAEIWAGGFAAGSRWVTVPVAALLGAVVAWRRVAPLAVVTIAGGAIVVQSLTATPSTSLLAFVTLLVFAYSLGAHADRTPLAVGAIVLLAAVWTVQLRDPAATVVDKALAPLVLVGAPLAAGLLAARQRRQSSQLRRLAADLAHERDRAGQAAVLEERTRIARELHDIVAHSLSVMIVQANAAAALLEHTPSPAMNTAGAAGAARPPGSSPARVAIEVVADTGRTALEDMRRLLGLLRTSPPATPQGPETSLRPASPEAPHGPGAGLGDLDGLLATARAAGNDVRVHLEGDPAALPAGLDLTAYRVIQEALTNTRRHAGAVPVDLAVRVHPDHLTIDILDTGRTGRTGRTSHTSDPVDTATEKSRPRTPGHGLIGMRERVAVYGGTLHTGPRPDGGWAVRVRLPRPDRPPHEPASP